jgi:hypothetical protein
MKNYALLKEDSPFYDLFPNGLVPIKNILVPSRVELEGSAEREAYLVNLEALTQEQVETIAYRLALLAQEVNVDLVRKEIVERGLPLRASQVRLVSTDCPWFL